MCILTVDRILKSIKSIAFRHLIPSEGFHFNDIAIGRLELYASMQFFQ